MTQKPALHIVESLTPEALQAAGMSERLIRHARSTGTFAASWYRIVRSLCQRAQIDCPLDAFNWKAPVRDSATTPTQFEADPVAPPMPKGAGTASMPPLPVSTDPAE